MFNIFKRSDKTPSDARTSARSSIKNARSSSRAESLVEMPVPVPDVLEGNLDSDWEMWEDSVLEQDSQMHSAYPDTAPQTLDAAASASEAVDLDPFAGVTKNAP